MDCAVTSVLYSSFISVLYVGSLYCWPNQTHRDDPKTIKRRFLSVFITIIISTIVLLFFNGDYKLSTLWISLGLNWPQHQTITEVVFRGVLVPILQTSVLFMGQIVIYLTQLQDFEWSYRNAKNSMNLIFVRNYVMAPITEELIFRGVLTAFMVKCWTLGATLVISSLLFGFAHSHHYIFETNHLRRVNGSAALEQMAYTSLFGMYASLLYFKSGLIITPIVVHSFCNLMGLPDFQSINSSKTVLFSTLFGIVLWILSLFYVYSNL